MRRYELMLLLRPDLEDDKLQSAVERVTRAIVNAGGSLSKVSPWGKRRLAYEIKRYREASYFLIHFDIEPSAVRGIERGMLISEEILRHLVTLLEDRGPQRQEAEPAVEQAQGSDTEPGQETADGDQPVMAEAVEPAEAAPQATAEPVADDGDTDGTAEEPATASEGAQR